MNCVWVQISFSFLNVVCRISFHIYNDFQQWRHWKYEPRARLKSNDNIRRHGSTMVKCTYSKKKLITTYTFVKLLESIFINHFVSNGFSRLSKYPLKMYDQYKLFIDDRLWINDNKKIVIMFVLQKMVMYLEVHFVAEAKIYFVATKEKHCLRSISLYSVTECIMQKRRSTPIDCKSLCTYFFI